MKLNVFERLVLLPILPAEGDFLTLKIMRELKESLSMSQTDLDEFEIKQAGEQVTWNEKGNEEREIEIGEKATEIVIDSLKKLDKEKKLTDRHFTVYEKFVK